MAAAPDIHGTVAPGFEPVRDAFTENFTRRGEVGAGVCIWHRGRLVVDLWGGVADPASGRAWEADTPTTMFSSTKGMSALCLLMLAERGRLDYDAPVADYWPGFAQAGSASQPGVGRPRACSSRLRGPKSGLSIQSQARTWAVVGMTLGR